MERDAADEEQAPAGLVTAANGVDPKQPRIVLRVPEPKVLAEIKSAWRADRMPEVLPAGGNRGTSWPVPNPPHQVMTRPAPIA